MATENVHVEKVKKILDEIRAMGATVTLEKRATREEIAAREEALGFRLPGEYRVFALELGGIEIELVRTWFFYGIESSVPVTKFYAEEVEPFREGADDEHGPYYPKRFVVLMDQGDYSNAGEGWVYDADLGVLFPMDGGRYVGREEASKLGYWAKLVEQLRDVRDRIADADDPLVAGAEAQVNARRKLPS